MTITRRSLLASLGVALPVAVTAAGAEAATASLSHHRKAHHGHVANAHTRHRRSHHAAAALKRAHPQA